jgi:hypothetical protein
MNLNSSTPDKMKMKQSQINTLGPRSNKESAKLLNQAQRDGANHQS